MEGRLTGCWVTLMSLRLTQANIRSLCGTGDSYWEVQGQQNNTFTCTGLSAQDTVQWSYWASNDDNTFLGSCPPRPSNGSQPVCDIPYDGMFVPSRISDDTGAILVNPTAVLNTRLFEQGRLMCTLRRQGVVGAAAGCRLDYIHAGENISCTVQFRNDTWNVFGQCNIGKTYSAQNRYRCEWIQTKQSPRQEILIANASMSSVASVGTKYVIGSCNITSSLPPDGNYTYRVTVVPGEVGVIASFIGSNEIRRPSATPSHTCPQYVPEGSDLSCICLVGDLGSPPGVLQWDSTRSTLLLLSNVQALETGTHVCQVLWNNTVVQSVQYTLHVAYGPKSVTPVVVSPQPLDTNGSQIITLSCSVSGSNPPANITWVRSSDASVLCNSQLCDVTPRPPDDDGAKLECRARNPVTNRVTSSSVTISLHYPPASPPVITGSAILTDSQPVYEGDNISLTCTVSGGKPVNATVITFTCPNKPDMADNSRDSSTSSSLTLDPVSPDNHGTCSCRTKWKTYDWHDRTASWVLNVYRPPSVPLIVPSNDTTGRPSYPFMEGTNGTLNCYSNQTGRPEATYTWPVAASGHVSGSKLSFYQLTREDNGRQVTCRASNSYTENRGPVRDATFVVDVYYEPRVSFTNISPTNDCSEISNSNNRVCVVAEGRRVNISCTADSNPRPESFRWSSKNKDVYSDTSELLISSANRSVHDGDYNCTVVTQQTANDNRLPLTSYAIFTVIVGVSPKVATFSINGLDNVEVSVRENSYLDMKCTCNGRPAPSIRLINAANPYQILNQSQPTGDFSVDEQTREVSLVVNRVQCEASGMYRCQGRNAVGDDIQTRMLLVSCSPRRNISENIPDIFTKDGKGQLSVSMTAYPTPEVKSVTYIGFSDSCDGRPVKEDILQVACSAKLLAPSLVICLINVINGTSSDECFYRIAVNNSVGEMAFSFFIKDAVQPEPVTKTENNTAAVVVLAVLFSVVIVLFVVAAVWSWRRGWSLPCADASQMSAQQKRRGDVSEECLTTTTTKKSDIREGGAAGLYDGLRLEDVGVRSPYEDIMRDTNTLEMSHYEVVANNRRREGREGPDYVNR